jgi:ABC-type multidrug transport system fused ATPase/permease subunit
MVLQGAISTGTFLATIKVFTELSENLSEAYEEMMKVTSAIGPLKKLTHYFNLETDLFFLKSVNRKRREQTMVARLEVMNEPNPTSLQHSEEPEGLGGFKTDRIELKIRGLSFTWPGASAPALSHVNMAVKQGKLVAVVGTHGSGKSTLLRLLGHSVFPDDGLIFIPTHLRILQISHDPILLCLSVWHNLIFGRPNADPKRVWKIMKDLETPKASQLLWQELEKMDLHAGLDGQPDADTSKASDEASNSDGGITSEEGEEAAMLWQDVLSHTEKAKIHLARALIVNPEVLVLHRPLSHYDQKTAEKVLHIIKYHVSNRGVQLPEHSAYRRRPRTCFFSPNRVDQAQEADVIWYVDGRGSVKCKRFHELGDMDLN